MWPSVVQVSHPTVILVVVAPFPGFCTLGSASSPHFSLPKPLTIENKDALNEDLSFWCYNVSFSCCYFHFILSLTKAIAQVIICIANASSSQYCVYPVQPVFLITPIVVVLYWENDFLIRKQKSDSEVDALSTQNNYTRFIHEKMRNVSGTIHHKCDTCARNLICRIWNPYL